MHAGERRFPFPHTVSRLHVLKIEVGGLALPFFSGARDPKRFPDLRGTLPTSFLSSTVLRDFDPKNFPHDASRRGL